MSDVITTGPDLQAADIFFGQSPIKTNWPQVITAIHNGEFDTERCLRELSRMEPIPIESADKHNVFIFQQMLRLCLRKDKDKPLLTDVTCPHCGTEKVDETLESCLACAEEMDQFEDHGYRGACRYLRAYYDPTTSTWGVLFYVSHHRHHDDSIYQFWVALGWPSKNAVMRALYPMSLFSRWMNRKLNGLGDDDPADFFGLEWLMEMKLPLSPADFELVLRQEMSERMTDPDADNAYAYRINEAIADYESKNRKQK